jgi:transcriptional regulator NrdR family protein
MICPRCASSETRVYGTQKGLVTVRFRKCTPCGYKFLTQELVKEDLLSHDYNNYLESIGELPSGVRQRALRED